MCPSEVRKNHVGWGWGIGRMGAQAYRLPSRHVMPMPEDDCRPKTFRVSGTGSFGSGVHSQKGNSANQHEGSRMNLLPQNGDSQSCIGRTVDQGGFFRTPFRISLAPLSNHQTSQAAFCAVGNPRQLQDTTSNINRFIKVEYIAGRLY
uniref:Uncharacterized protein n=1 Tax=Anopheles culicifacies TaxID=139723 RepID=A0A182MAW5_9DIPT